MELLEGETESTVWSFLKVRLSQPHGAGTQPDLVNKYS